MRHTAHTRQAAVGRQSTLTAGATITACGYAANALAIATN